MAVSPPVKLLHVVPDDPLIKIYGVCNSSHIDFLDTILESQADKLFQIRSPNDAAPGKTVLVPRFRKYRRAVVLSSEDGGR